MMRGVKFSSGWTAFLLVFEATICTTQKHFLFVDAKFERVLRGSQSNTIRLDGLLHRELPEASTNKKKNSNNKKEDRVKTNKKERNGVASIEASLPEDSDVEDSGRDKIESPIISSESLENSENITTEPNSGASKQIESTLPNATPNASSPLHSDNVFDSAIFGETEPEHSVSTTAIEDAETPEPIIHLPDNKHPEVVFDETEFVTVTQMEPIMFDITARKFTTTVDSDELKTFDIAVSEFTTVVESDELKAFFKNFFEDVLDMRSNGNWYPSHAKSIHDLSIAFRQSAVPQLEKAEGIPNDKIQVQLIINGYVAVHTNSEGVEATTARTRNAGKKKQTISFDDTVPDSTFHESFDHSMLLYFTFWGVESLEQMLKKEGLQNPVINSVSVGEKEVITFGIDKDDNYLYEGDHNSAKPHRIPAEEISDFDDSSSARASKYCLLKLILISVVGLTI